MLVMRAYVIPAKAGIHCRPIDSRFRGNDSIGTGIELEYPDYKVKVHKRESIRHNHRQAGAILMCLGS